MSKTARRNLTLLLVVLLVMVVLSIVALVARWRFLTRGMPQELPGPNPHAGVSPFGINVEMLDWDDAAREKALAWIANSGFRWIKQPVPWGQEGGFAHLLEGATAMDLSVVPLLDGDPADHYAPPDDLQAFAGWVGEFAARYGDRVDYYQIWDEPNLGSHWGWKPVNPAGYAALLAAAREAITAADPGAVIVAAALAPTLESGAENLSDLDYLEALYQLEADAFFDVAAGKPYGFDTGPDDRRVDRDVLNFSRLILLREVMERNGDSGSAVWAGNFGWNAFPAGWSGRPSIWGQTDAATQAANTRAAYQRALDEWPWAGVLFLENYAPTAPPDDPRWGFALITHDGSHRHSSILPPQPDSNWPIPNYRIPTLESPGQTYTGGWRFRSGYGADVSQTGDRALVEFDGTDFGLRVRRGDYRAYFYISVDGRPANALPTDERGAYLCLTSPDREGDDVATIPVARYLEPGRHTAEIVAERGWDQWALVGLTAANLPDERPFHRALFLLCGTALALAVAAIWTGRGVEWGRWGALLRAGYGRLGRTGQAAMTAAMAALFALTGYLTWLLPTGSPFRRLEEGPGTLLFAATAALFYLSPWLLLNLTSGAVLFLLICWRLDLGLALIALCAPFYVYPKPMMGYRFSMVELVTLMTFGAWVVNQITNCKSEIKKSGFGIRDSGIGKSKSEIANCRSEFVNQESQIGIGQKLANRLSDLRFGNTSLDLAVTFFALVAVISLCFTERLDVASNELRVVVLEPVLFYLMLRSSRLNERGRWWVVDGLVLGGLIVAVAGLVWYASGSHVITAEGGVPRLRSIYGSPNNVGLYLGRIIPIMLAVSLTGQGRRRWLYGLTLLPVLAAAALSFSKGAILLGLPVGVGLVLAWLAVARWGGRRAAMALGGLAILVVLGLLVGSRIPALAGRLSLAGATTDFRVSLWKATMDMIEDHPWTGVGLDNFLYQYRGRYLRPEAWQEPNLSHPHNLVLDFWVRLGILGLVVLGWLQVAYWKKAWWLARQTRSPATGFPDPLILGLIGSMGATVAHGLVDQGYFLIDLAYAFMLAVGLVASTRTQ